MDNHLKVNDQQERIDITFIVIGYNEGDLLENCFLSVKNVKLQDISYELIYVDGGSEDDSIKMAQNIGVDEVLGGEKRRKAAENRNLGLKAARGRFVQFLDGDMVLEATWPHEAIRFLIKNEDSAAVCGRIEEIRPSVFYRALQFDWQQKDGEVAYCGGAAMWSKAILKQMEGFPENVDYGEEPYLCWRIRNELKLKINYLDRTMVQHDLAYKSFGDYWHRNVRCGETYAEIAHRFYHTKDRLHTKEAIRNLIWGGVLTAAFLGIIFGPAVVKLFFLLMLTAILFRKTLQMSLQAQPFAVALVYACHTYFSKLSLAWGTCRWFFRNYTLLSKKNREERPSMS